MILTTIVRRICFNSRLSMLPRLILLLICIAPSWANAADTQQTLRSLAQARGFHVGTSVDESALQNDRRYAEILAREFTILTPENSLKFSSVHPAPFRYDFDTADKVIAFAQDNEMEIHGHVLVWNEQLPHWLTKGKFSREQLSNILRQHVYHVVGRYRGQIVMWDVVSEAIADDGTLRDTFWLRGIGPDYIQLAFQWAHEADPAAVLIYNDYGGEGLNHKSNKIYKLIKNLLKRGAPIHGVGLQMHISPDLIPNHNAFTKNINRLKNIGLQVHITEMDVRLKKPAGKIQRATQAKIYAEILGSCLSSSSCNSFSLWGFSDKYSWIPEYFPGWGAALIFDESFHPKPAYKALIETLGTK